jgi:hypothetical protein
MDSIIRKIKLQALKAQVDVCRLQCECLVGDFETAPTYAARAKLADRRDHFLNTGYAAQFMVDLMVRQDEESAER